MPPMKRRGRQQSISFKAARFAKEDVVGGTIGEGRLRAGALCMGAGMATFSVWEIEFYLAQRYSKEWAGYCKATPWLLLPGLY